MHRIPRMRATRRVLGLIGSVAPLVSVGDRNVRGYTGPADARRQYSNDRLLVSSSNFFPFSQLLRALASSSWKKVRQVLSVILNTSPRLREGVDYSLGRTVIRPGSSVSVGISFLGGLEKNKHSAKKLRSGRGTTCKVPVVGLLDKRTNRLHVQAVEVVNGPTLRTILRSRIVTGAELHSDQASVYREVPGIIHESVNHTVRASTCVTA